ncbi:conserved hypothetical protein [Methanohalobium evestigatum Z-7303]|uniref:Uncharacterized protein n=1 Tax=Methanohalobium evestigatum (strain ATCC BAA-1072 / DSM 3721 / NBRC 107634 / OCM 161 / Z-7303) TaxID=644295 RepID=D7E6Q5_METEZ|nr:UvrD-helicase domain-containing protein [Methanohalobium evestigatum]ADI73277.1 conserved hypothetical protein [Methanohalobium evestigatum Z-7303]
MNSGLTVIPSDLSSLRYGERKVANKIKQIYSDVDWKAYLYVQPSISNLEPDFILIDEYKGISIIEVKDWSLDKIDISKLNPAEVFVSGHRRENPFSKANTYFNTVKNRLQKEPELIDEDYSLKYQVYSNLVFTNMQSEDLELIEPYIFKPPARCLTSDNLNDLTFEELFGDDTRYIDDHDFNRIRSVFFPEIQVNSRQKEIWEFHRNNTKDNSIIKTLDTDQEKFSKRIPYGHYMVSGVPGSGKTVILVARAVHLARENPEWNILILTYNRSLKSKLKNILKSMHKDLDNMGVNYENIEISSFHKTAMKVANETTIPKPTPDNYWDELLPYKAINNVESMYDAVLIDEYQDFHNIWLKLCLKLCRKHEYKGEYTENLFLAGDRLQSIYNPSTHNWKSLGIHIRGRSKLLKTSYRSGSTHINLALEYLMKNSNTRSEVEKFYEGKDGICCNYDTENNVDFLNGDFREINDYLKSLIYESQYNPEDILVLLPFKNLRDKLYRYLDEDLQKMAEVSKNISDNLMTITTYHSSKGVECKVCVLAEVDKLENSKMDNTKYTKLLYVGMTRASEKVMIQSSHPENGTIFNELLNCYNDLMDDEVEVENQDVDTEKSTDGVTSEKRGIWSRIRKLSR